MKNMNLDKEHKKNQLIIHLVTSFSHCVAPVECEDSVPLDPKVLRGFLYPFL